MNPETRTALLHGFAVVVRACGLDSVTGGAGVVRLLRQAGATWSDLLGPPGTTSDQYQLLLATYGHRADLPAIAGMLMRAVHVATPFNLARAAVLAAGPWSQANQDELATIAQNTLAAAAQDAPALGWLPAL